MIGECQFRADLYNRLAFFPLVPGLRECAPNCTPARLGMKHTALQSKMKKLGISLQSR